jgi:hypothetical protein
MHSDVVRKRWVLDCGLPAESRQYSGVMDCMRKIVRQEGVRGLYRFYGCAVLPTYRAVYV